MRMLALTISRSLAEYLHTKGVSVFEPVTGKCSQTGQPVHPFPRPCEPSASWPERWLMAYYREDGAQVGIGKCTQEELRWLDANPEAYQSEKDAFNAWLKSKRV